MSNTLRSIALCILLSGCAGYKALVLNSAPDPSTALEHVTIDAASMPFPALAAHRFDPSDGLDVIEVAMFAVLNNPDLKSARGDLAIAHAQAFAAGLLPDPQLALSGDLSNTGGPGSVLAHSFGLSYDVNALLLRSSARAAAESETRKTDLTLLWQEWQVVSQARLLFVKLVQANKLMVVLDTAESMSTDRLRRVSDALVRGLLPSDAVTPNLVALQDVQRQIFELKKQISQNTHEFNALLGLAPDAIVHLQDGADFAPIDEPAVLAALRDQARRRPDLLALEAGYQAQDQRYRGALLAQFPALNVGLARARDSSGVDSNAVGITLALPFFNRNRGNIAIEQTTRQKLFDEYQLRMQAGRNDVHRILDQQRLNMGQLAQQGGAILKLTAALERSEVAFKASNIDALVYASARAALLADQVEQINLEQAVLEQRIALQTLLGVEPASQAPSESHAQ